MFGIDADSLANRIHEFRQGLARELGRLLGTGVHQEIRIAQVGQRLLELVLEDVSHGDEFHTWVSGEEVYGCFRAASAAADQARSQALLSRAAHQFGFDEGKRRRCRSGA